MIIKKYLISMFIIFALSFSYQPSNFVVKEVAPIVYIMDYNKDKITDDFIKTNEAKRICIYVSLTMQCMIASAGVIEFDSS